MSHPDTIVAAATPPGRGGVGVVRVSGPKAPEIAATLIGELPEPRHATLARFLDVDGTAIDIGIALFFPGPHSYTGEHVVELQGHGGPVVMERLVERVLTFGARRARPGEFTERAFLNDKIDLAQAEAVADLIDAGSREAARAAMRSLEGEFSSMVQGLNDALIDLRTYVEAAIDFPEEEVDFLDNAELRDRLSTVRGHFEGVAAAAGQGRLLRDGITVVLAGRPNAGKSSLLNRLAGYEAAIVTEVPGTTRDVLRERIDIDGLPLHVLDTAGLRDSDDIVEREGVRRAAVEMARADRVLFVIDTVNDPGGRAFEEERKRLPDGVPVTLLFNKIDIAPGPPVGDTVAGPPRIHVSAASGAGLDVLRSHLKDSVSFHVAGNGSISARRRHLEALARARECVETAARELEQRRAGELVAEELRAAQRALEEITGTFTADDLLGRIFGSFCIGK
jgi:tRNA modification GTPase